MLNKISQPQKYMLSALLGAIAGGLIVAVATNAIPRMMETMLERCAQRGDLPDM